MRILVLNGPNINLLGLREPGVYGSDSYADLLELIRRTGEEEEVETEVLQSNHEGDLVDGIQQALGRVDGLVLNPGAYPHTSIALLDALKAVRLPAVEVHISAVERREAVRQVSYIRPACFLTITGEGIAGYARAIRELKAHILAAQA